MFNVVTFELENKKDENTLEVVGNVALVNNVIVLAVKVPPKFVKPDMSRLVNALHVLTSNDVIISEDIGSNKDVNDDNPLNDNTPPILVHPDKSKDVKVLFEPTLNNVIIPVLMLG
jgi:hypothetical protein